MNNFDDIRPYNDSEVRPVLDRILANRELIRAVARLKFPRLTRRVPWLICPLVRQVMRYQLAGVNCVRDAQLVVVKYMHAMMARTVTAMTVSGIEKLEPGKAYIFISNHRDIALDPAFVNIALFDNANDTVRIAIGDNLLTRDYVADLMRLNKSFIVKRSAKSPRDKLKASKHLSAFIHHSINDENSHIWIAQREGRAKDGNDRTNSAIISMLTLNRPRAEPFADYIRELDIVPVAISYEWDPCDAAKARELHSHRESGSYQKQEHEDIASIAAGIAGVKGHVHLAFGDCLTQDFDSQEAVAAEIDRQIHRNYVLHPSNHIAYEMLYGKPAPVPVTRRHVAFDRRACPAQIEQFRQRLEAIPAAQRDIFLAMYANPVVNKLKLAASAVAAGRPATADVSPPAA